MLRYDHGMKNNIPLFNSHSPLVGIVADDFTSAADAAGPFVARGYRSLVSRRANLCINQGVSCDEAEPADVDVFSLDSGSRLLSAQDAASATEQSMGKLLFCRLLFKTIDSTLRGNIQAELKATMQIALSSGKYDRVVIAPAFPEAGRITRGGVQFVDGLPVSKSSYGRDPVHPVSISTVSDLLDPYFGDPLVIPHAADVSEVMLAQSNTKIFILDAESQQGLTRQVTSIATPERVLWVGSPGLASALADLLPLKAKPETINKTLKCKRVLILVGSANKVSRDQCAHLANSGAPVMERATGISDEDFNTARIICLSAPAKRNSHPNKVRDDLVQEAKIAMRSGNFDAVIATGGETMVAFLEALGIDAISLKGELEPGFPYGQSLSGARSPPLTLAMKAGGFGSPAMLLDAARQFLSTSDRDNRCQIY
mgnify:CR=1 FL=1